LVLLACQYVASPPVSPCAVSQAASGSFGPGRAGWLAPKPVPEHAAGQDRAERQHRRHLARAQQVLRVRADHVGARVGQDGHGEHRHDQVAGPEDPHHADDDPDGDHERAGQVQPHEGDLGRRRGAVEGRVEDVRAEQLEEALEGHPRPVLQLAQVGIGADGRLLVAAPGGHHARPVGAGQAADGGRHGQAQLVPRGHVP
jgi:hypothetical protein